MQIRVLKFSLSILIILVCSQGRTQDTLTLQTFLANVFENHPLIKKATLYDEIASAYDLQRRGVLDPKLYSDFDRKLFDDKTYFNIWNTEAKIPTRLPIDFSVGYERNDGLFLNPENSVPNNGLVYGSIDISLLRGLLFDEQRFHMQAAELSGIKGQIEQDILIREIIFQAIIAYVEWAEAQSTYNIYQNYLELIQIRHQNIIELYLNGDKPAVDTLESRVNLNTAEKLLLSSNDKLISKRQKLSLFIWDDEENPLEIQASLYPMAISRLLLELENLSSIGDPNVELDPLIRKIENEIAFLELDNRLEKEFLKPELNLKFNTLVNLGDNAFQPAYSFNDYKYGIGFQYPILNRKVKGKIRLNNALIDQSRYDGTQYRGQLLTKFRALESRRLLQVDLVNVTQEKITNSLLLLDAEQLKFSIGESSIFLLNQRELKLLESRIELIKTYAGFCHVLNELYFWKLGQEVD